MMTPDLLNFIRHLSKQDRKSLSQKTLKVGEEFGELARAVLPYDNAYATTHRFIERGKILEEAVDTILCALSVAYDLDFTDEEIVAMFHRKTEYWALLQSKEQDVKYPIPYEIHITVTATTPEDIRLFKYVCGRMQCKAIVLDLQAASGETAMTDVMTSSKHIGTNRSAYICAQDIASSMERAGLVVTRIKIETVPWHPAAPIEGQTMPPNCYFEAHIPITLHEDRLAALREATQALKRNGLKVHASRNMFKRNPDNSVVLMITLREHQSTYAQFKTQLDAVVLMLSAAWNVGMVHTEFAVYDTKVSHDNQWITSS